MPYPDGTEEDGEIPFAGMLFDRGGAFFNVMHPDFGAMGDDDNNDGVAINAAIQACPSAGGAVIIPAGVYSLGTAISFGAKTNILLIVLPGASFTLDTLPAVAATNRILDLRPSQLAGVYTPTGTVVANLDSVTPQTGHWMRIGEMVMVFGSVTVDATAGDTLTRFGLSLPIASNFGAIEQCAGTGAVATIAGEVVTILGDVTNDRAEFRWVNGASSTASMVIYYSFMYKILPA